MARNRSGRRESMAWSTAGVALAVAAISLAAAPADTPQYDAEAKGTRWLDGPGGIKVKMLVEPTSLGGGELELGEITFPAEYKKSPPHRHAQVELFYVLEGKLGHAVNGVEHVIEPGMVGIVRPGDSVVHSVESDGPVRALVIWAPGGEAEILIKAGVFKPRPLDDES